MNTERAIVYNIMILTVPVRYVGSHEHETDGLPVRHGATHHSATTLSIHKLLLLNSILHHIRGVFAFTRVLIIASDRPVVDVVFGGRLVNPDVGAFCGGISRQRTVRQGIAALGRGTRHDRGGGRPAFVQGHDAHQGALPHFWFVDSVVVFIYSRAWGRCYYCNRQ